MMLVKIGAGLAGVVLVSTLTAPAAYARGDDDTRGGHCSYGDFSVNVMPHCDTSSSRSGGSDETLPDNHGGTTQLPPLI